MADFIQEAEQLRAELNQANYEYYVLDNPSTVSYTHLTLPTNSRV